MKRLKSGRQVWGVIVMEKMFQVTRLDEVAKTMRRERNRRRLRTEPEKLWKREVTAGRQKRTTSVGGGTPAAGPGSHWKVCKEEE